MMIDKDARRTVNVPAMREEPERINDFFLVDIEPGIGSDLLKQFAASKHESGGRQCRLHGRFWKEIKEFWMAAQVAAIIKRRRAFDNGTRIGFEGGGRGIRGRVARKHGP